MYHEQSLRQPEIAERLHISQSRVSRLLKEAGALGIVRTIVIAPSGVYPDLEEGIRAKFGLLDVVVAEPAGQDDVSLLRALGGSGAAYLETALTGSERVGISSWSATLLATVDSLAAGPVRTAQEVVQVIGGVGNPSVQVNATRLTESLARATGATPRFLPAPGIVGSSTVRDALMSDTHIQELAAEWPKLTIVLAGVGSLQPSPLLKDSGNAVNQADLEELRKAGAVGDVCLRFFDASGRLIESTINDRVVGISSDDLLRVPRRVGVAGGARKLEAIRAALLGGWINVLITDKETATALLD
ncbi:MAG: sugar-binding transcriptional regulator [Salinibacterium sp.]|nr:sugar-binding transcriptional regulator [Salinibacterium sp.]